MPNDAELRRTGMSFTRAFTATAMCSPSRASFLTGHLPVAPRGDADADRGRPVPRPRATLPDVLRTVGAAWRSAARRRAARLARAFARGLLRLGPKSGNEPELPPGTDTLATLLRERGYHVALKGKWHLSKPVDGGEWSAADPRAHRARLRLRRLGAARRRRRREGRDVRRRQRRAPRTRAGTRTTRARWRRWLAPGGPPRAVLPRLLARQPARRARLPVLLRARAATRADEFRDLGVPLPPTLDEDLRDKPTVQALMKLGQTVVHRRAATGGASSSDYVDFYAHLHRVVDEKIGRLLAALGDPGDPASLRSRTVIVRTSDHGELGLSHGGLRQKMFNAYEESIRVPLVVSNPVLFPEPRESDALVSLVDLVPTLLGLAGRAGAPGALRRPRPRPAAARRARRASATRCCSPTTTTRPATAFQEAPGQPNRIRCVRDARWKYAVYLDPTGARRARVRALRPRGRPRRGAEPRRQAHRRAGGRRRRGASACGCTRCSSALCAASGHDVAAAAARPGRRRLGARAPALTRRARGGAAGRLRRASAEGVERRRHAGARRREARHPPGGA